MLSWLLAGQVGSSTVCQQIQSLGSHKLQEWGVAHWSGDQQETCLALVGQHHIFSFWLRTQMELFTCGVPEPKSADQYFSPVLIKAIEVTKSRELRGKTLVAVPRRCI